jgi:hypothetical protein
MADHTRPGTSDLEDLAEVLFERVRQTASASVHAVAFAREVFEHRGDYLDALHTLRRVETEDHHELFLSEVRRVYLRDHERLTGAGLRSELLVEWIGVLVESLTAVQATLADLPVPFHEFLDEDDLAIMAEDRQLDGDVGARGISEAWQS